MRVLRGESEREHVDRRVVRRQYGARLDRRSDQPRHAYLRLHDGVGSTEGSGDIALGAAPPQEDVVRCRLVQRRGRLRLARLVQRRELVDVDDHGLGRVGRQFGRIGDHDCNRLPDVAHALGGEYGMHHRHDLRAVAGDERERVHEPFDVHRGEHRVHAAHPTRRIRVDRDDAPVRVRAAHECRVQHPWELQVADVGRFALDEALVLQPGEVTPHPRDSGSVDGAHAAPLRPIRRSALPPRMAASSSAASASARTISPGRSTPMSKG